MNEFDRYLEVELRHMLDPVVVAKPPSRGGLREPRKPVLVILRPAISLAADAILVVEPVAVAAAPARTI